LQGLELEFPLLWEQWLARGGHVSLVYLVRFTVFPALVLLCAGIGCVALLETRSSDIANSLVFRVVLAGAWFVIGLCGGMALPAAWSLFGKSGFVRPAAKESDLRPALDLGQSK
jgi:hypothetical protein